MLNIRKKTIIPLPFLYYYIPLLIIAMIGFADSIYLSIAHYRVYTDIGYESFCAVSRSINCDTVSQSPYSIFLNVPVPVWGVIGYTITLFILVLAGIQKSPKNRLWALLFWCSLIYSLISIVLATISARLIHSYCIMCILSYLVNFALVYYAWFINRRFGNSGLLRGGGYDFRYLFVDLKKIVIPAAISFVIGCGAVMLWFPEYWHLNSPEISSSTHYGMTSDGYPWIGAENPDLVIEEFTDYQCFQCRKMHYFLRLLINQHPDKLRLIHRHFPMDQKFNPLVKEPYHTGSGMLSLFAIYAGEEGKFWKANDLFYEIKPLNGVIGTKHIADELDLNPQGIVLALHNRHILYKLQKDIEDGLKFGFIGTPGYVINGKAYQGNIPSHILSTILR